VIEETIPSALDGERVDRVVSLLTACSRAEASVLVAEGAVLVAGRPVTKPSTKVTEGSVLTITRDPVAAPAGIEADPGVSVAVVHEDGDVLVVDKPPGLVVHPGAGNATGTLVHGLVARYPELTGVGPADRPGIVHRIDKETSGLLMVARTERAYRSLRAQLDERTVGRRYVTLAWGHLDAGSGVIDAPIGRSGREPTRMTVASSGREARTRYEVVQTFSDPAALTLLRCQLETGRTHQIRVHLAAIGHPVVGDARYGGKHAPLADVPRFFLHAEHLAFDHPATGERLSFDAPLPSDLLAVLARVS
jgi:23S rRNA pseudouridine1911/1915/1917 synthase